MGRDAGWIAYASGVAGGAHVVLVPELEIDIDHVCALLKYNYDHGKHYGVVVVAEGCHLPEVGQVTGSTEVDSFGHARLSGIGEALADLIEKKTGFETRSVNLGHTQRGGVPTAYDRLLGQRYGLHAIDMVHQKKWGRIAVLKGLDITDITIKEAIATNRRLDRAVLQRDSRPGSEGLGGAYNSSSLCEREGCLRCRAFPFLALFAKLWKYRSLYKPQDFEAALRHRRGVLSAADAIRSPVHALACAGAEAATWIAEEDGVHWRVSPSSNGRRRSIEIKSHIYRPLKSCRRCAGRASAVNCCGGSKVRACRRSCRQSGCTLMSRMRPRFAFTKRINSWRAGQEENYYAPGRGALHLSKEVAGLE